MSDNKQIHNRHCSQRYGCKCSEYRKCNNFLLPTQIINAPLSPNFCSELNDGFGFLAVDSCADNVSIARVRSFEPNNASISSDETNNVSFWKQKDNFIKNITKSPLYVESATYRNISINFNGDVTAVGNPGNDPENYINNICVRGFVNIYDKHCNLKSTIVQPTFSNKKNTLFGQSVSLDSSGELLLVSDLSVDDDQDNNRCILYKNSNQWDIFHVFNEKYHKTNDNVLHPVIEFGFNGVISQDSKTVVIPAYIDDADITLYYIYRYSISEGWQLLQVLEINDNDLADFDISRDAKFIAIVGINSISLYKRNYSDGKYEREIFIYNDNIIYTAPKFSWDGKHLAYARFVNPVLDENVNYVKSEDFFDNRRFGNVNRYRKYVNCKNNEVIIYNLDKSNIERTVNIGLVNSTDVVYSLGLNYDATKLFVGLPYPSQKKDDEKDNVNGQVLVYDFPKSYKSNHY